MLLRVFALCLSLFIATAARSLAWALLLLLLCTLTIHNTNAHLILSFFRCHWFAIVPFRFRFGTLRCVCAVQIYYVEYISLPRCSSGRSSVEFETLFESEALCVSLRSFDYSVVLLLWNLYREILYQNHRRAEEEKIVVAVTLCSVFRLVVAGVVRCVLIRSATIRHSEWKFEFELH